jgi:AraC-like DNA-binding protein
LQDRRLSITDVAIRLGFNDSNYFSTVYKKITGVSPRCSKAASKNYDVIKETEKSKEALGSRF